MAEKNLYYLHELSDYKVASDYPDVRGWEVKEAEGKVIGKVDNLLVSKKDERVVYLDVELDESILSENYDPHAIPASEGVHGFTNKDGDNHLIVPIGLVDLDEDNKIVHSNEINYNTFRAVKRHKRGSTIDRGEELVIYKNYVPNTGSESVDEEDFYNRKEFRRRK
jgi:hypothetical protein